MATEMTTDGYLVDVARTSKRGRHGTLYLFSVLITSCDPGLGQHRTRVWAYDADHAIDRVESDPMVEGDTVESAIRVRS